MADQGFEHVVMEEQQNMRIFEESVPSHIELQNDGILITCM